MSFKCYLKSKIHHATVTDSNVNYIGSIFIDNELLEKSGIEHYEKVEVINVNNGNRWETYAVPDKKGVISVNGGGARLCENGDKLIILSYSYSENIESLPKMILVDGKNNFVKKL